ncbi:MFS transporter [Solibacillus sp. FSL W7-1464]|uniref:MFS transporter n=1 Tax=Solibacillus sp. FSL W7-1464 TaxID=2921706 RepID=UPI0030FA3D8F
MHTEVLSEQQQRKLYKRTLWIIITSQIFGGAGLAAGVTVGALLAKDMMESDAIAGLPTALFTLGSALAAFSIGAISHKRGRRIGLATGFFIGTIGALGVIYAAAIDSIVLLFSSLFLYGAGTATNLQARYAGTDLATPTTRGKAISLAMVFTTIGAVAGPNLVAPTGRMADSIGLPTLTGPFILAAVAYGLAGVIIFFLLKPDPLLVARTIETKTQVTTESTEKRPLIYLGAIVMIVTQVIMVAIMTMTPIHMTHHGHSLSAVGLVIGMHIGAMYLPSLVTGALVDKFGRSVMIIASSVTLFLSGVIGTFSPADSLLSITIALTLLGVGWNFGLISGTALIIDGTTLKTRAKVQGTTDVSIAVFGASAGLLSGVFMSMSSFGTLAFVGGVIGFILLPVLYWATNKTRS